MKAPRKLAKRKWTKGGKLVGRPPGSRSHDPSTSRADNPPTKPPERRGRPPVGMGPMILRFVQMEVGRGRTGFAKRLAEEETGVAVETVKRRMRQDRSDAREREANRKSGKWTFE